MPDPFAVAEELSRFSGLITPDDLARMQMLLDSASAEIRGFTGQTLSQVTGDVVQLGPSSSRSLYLPEAPVTAITTLVVKGVTIASTEYSFTEKGRIVHGGTPADYSQEAWPDGATVTYNHGWAEGTTEYQRIKTVCIQAALRAFTRDEQGVAEAMGGTIMQTAGYVPMVFLTQEEQRSLMTLEIVGVG